MSTNPKPSIADRDIPLHTFGMGIKRTHEELPFEYLNFDAAPTVAKATYPHRHNFYEILYVTGGIGTHFIDFQAFPIEPNTFYFISPGQVHYWETIAPIEGEILAFTDEFLALAPADYMVLSELSFFHTILGSPTLKLNDIDRLQTASLLGAIIREFKTYELRAASVLRAYLHILLVQLQRICATREGRSAKEQDAAAQKLTRRFKQLVDAQFVTNQSVQSYAEQLNVSVNHLNKMVKAATDRTPGQLLRQAIVLEAKRLFQHTNLSAAEVAYRLSFDDPSYFGRFFKREAGVTPGKFRLGLT
ncbi:MAG: AraC family transcriptional regulator [Chloroflexota bacterium]